MGAELADLEAAIGEAEPMSIEVAAPIAVRRGRGLRTRSRIRPRPRCARQSEAADRASCTLLADPRGAAQARRRGATGLGACAEPPSDVDLCLVLGGDGSILQALRTFAGTEMPVFGINFGTVGFLAAAERDELEQRPRARVQRRLRGR